MAAAEGFAHFDEDIMVGQPEQDGWISASWRDGLGRRATAIAIGASVFLTGCGADDEPDRVANPGFGTTASPEPGPDGETLLEPAPELGDDTDATAGAPDTVFYEPRDMPAGLAGLWIADIRIPYADWTAGNCSPEAADDRVPTTADTLSGWSLGRLGPVYFLRDATPEEEARIQDVVLLDPGNSEDFQGSCDEQVNASAELKAWLEDDVNNQLTIIAGQWSMELDQAGEPTHRGIRQEYLHGIDGTPLLDQVEICSYENLSHETVLREFADIVENPPAECPDLPNGQRAEDGIPQK